MYKTEQKFQPKNKGENGKSYKASSFWSHITTCPSTRTLSVFPIVSRLDTVTKSLLRRISPIFGEHCPLGGLTKRLNLSRHQQVQVRISTYQSLQRAAEIGFPVIRRIERCRVGS